MQHDLNKLVETYLRQHETNSDEDFWAFQEVCDILRSRDLDLAWQVTLLLLREAGDNALGYVAAGPLEDLIDIYGDQALDLVEQACDGDMRLQFALSGVWLLPESPVLGRFRALMTKYGFGLAEDKRQPLSPHPDCWGLTGYRVRWLISPTIFHRMIPIWPSIWRVKSFLRFCAVATVTGITLLASVDAMAQCDSSSDAPVTNAPYSAVRRAVTVKRNSDGTSSRSESTQDEARGSSGRTYKAGERGWTTEIGGKPVKKSEMLVRIFDPVANTDTTWDTTQTVAKVVHFPPPTGVYRPSANAFSFEATAKRLGGKNLGSKTIDDVLAEGMGFKTNNSRHECWFSRELDILVLQVDEYPDSSFTNRLENIRLGEPDVSRYKVPSGYSENHVHLEQFGAKKNTKKTIKR